MRLTLSILALVLLVLYLLVLARVVLEVTRSFARSWRPAGAAAIGIELVYLSTDPPVKALRRLIPPLRIGQVSIDVSVVLLLITLYLTRIYALRLAQN